MINAILGEITEPFWLLLQVVGEGNVVEKVDFNTERSLHFLSALGLAMLLVFANLLQPALLQQVARGLASLNDFRQMVVEEATMKYAVVLLLLFSFINIGLVIFQNVSGDSLGGSALGSIMLVVAFSLFLMGINSVFFQLFYGKHPFFNIHLTDLVLFMLYLGFVAFAILLAQWFSAYSTAALFRGAVVVMVLVYTLFRLARLSIGLSRDFRKNVFFNFFYLCAVEIIPYLIIGKVITNLT